MKKILVVDDNQQHVRLLEAALHRENFAVMSAGDGKQALEIADDETPDLVISDILMPSMDGFALCRSWKKNNRLRSIPFLFYTATYTDEKDEAYALSLGASRFLRKPLPLADLINHIEAVINESGQQEGNSGIPKIEDKEESYKQYSERLVQKLEKKLVDLENEVSTRKQIKEELRQSRLEWEEIFQAIGDPTLIIDSDFTILQVNEATRKALRNPETDLLGKKCYEVFHRTDQAQKDCPLAGLKTGERVITQEVELEALKGTYIVSCTPIFHRDGTLEKAIHILIDISERKQLMADIKQKELATKKQLAELENIYSNAPIGLAYMNEHLEFVRINHALAEINGLAVSDHIGRKLTDVLPELAPVIEPIYKRVLETGEPALNFEVHGATKAEPGKQKGWLVSYYPLADSDGKIIGVNTIVLEITERMESEQSLLRMKRLLNEAQELGKIGAWEIDPDRKFSYWTDNMHRLLGYEPGEIVDKYRFFFAHVVHPDDRARISGMLQRLVNDKKPISIEFRALHKDGRELILHGIAVPELDEEDRLSRIYGTSIDISEQKRMDDERRKLQEQLLKAQKMESIGTLAGGIAHDFNNILSAVIGYTEIAWEQAGDASAVHDSLKEVLQASRRAKDLVAQILAFSRQVEQEFAPVQIQLIVKEVAKLLRASLPSNITIETDIQSFASVMAEAGQIHQVLMNLCTNAYQSMNDNGGVLTLKLNEIELGQSLKDRSSDLKSGEYLELIVQDTGCGMDETTISRIFDPYFSTKNPDEGTGLGLSVVFGIVKSHGGSIDVDSKVNQGSIFRILLPLIKKAAIDETDDFLDRAERGNERILFVDDEWLLAKMAKQTLESLGYHVLTKTNSMEALESFQASPDEYDLIITDMMMPHMTGEYLANEILKIRPAVPMIICTGFSDRIDEKEAQALGFKAFIRKPWRKAEMAGAIRKALDN